MKIAMEKGGLTRNEAAALAGQATAESELGAGKWPPGRARDICPP
jgi:hypothetical protein